MFFSKTKTNEPQGLFQDLKDSDVRQLMIWAQGQPPFLSFAKACNVVAELTGISPEKVMTICRVPEWTPEIVEAMRIPETKKIGTTGTEIMVF